MNVKYTPGPWTYSTSEEGWSYNIAQADDAAYTDGWSDVGYIIKTCKGENQGIQEANARLIAAAPELFEFVKEWIGKQGSDENYMLLKARAVIDKATGAKQ